MKRSFDSADLVLLPVLDAPRAVALGEKLFTHAKHEELAEPEVLTLRRLKRAHSTLRDATVARLEAEPAGEVDRRDAYREQSAAIGGMHAWLMSWAGVPQAIGGEKRAEAARILAALFGDGLKFLQLPYDAGWVEADNRVRWLEEHDVDDVFTKLGGIEILEHVRAAHEKYGEVLGITKTGTPATELPSIREPLDAFCAGLRDYVVQVAAQAGIGDDEAKERAARLLAPLAHWQSRKANRRVKTEPPEAEPLPAPTPPIN